METKKNYYVPTNAYMTPNDTELILEVWRNQFPGHNFNYTRFIKYLYGNIKDVSNKAKWLSRAMCGTHKVKISDMADFFDHISKRTKNKSYLVASDAYKMSLDINKAATNQKHSDTITDQKDSVSIEKKMEYQNQYIGTLEGNLQYKDKVIASLNARIDEEKKLVKQLSEKLHALDKNADFGDVTGIMFKTDYSNVFYKLNLINEIASIMLNEEYNNKVSTNLTMKLVREIIADLKNIQA